MKEYLEIEGADHPSPEDVAAYISGAIGDADRERIEAHAADCAVCRREFAEVIGALPAKRRTRDWRVWAPALAAAAVIAVVMAHPFRTAVQPEGTSRFRGSEPTAGRGGGAVIGVLAPPDDGAVNPAAVTFVWHAGGVDASYQLTLTDEEGSVVWTLATTDTVAALPDTITLARGSLYHWYVDGLLEDGRRASTGVHSFTTGR